MADFSIFWRPDPVSDPKFLILMDCSDAQNTHMTEKWAKGFNRPPIHTRKI